MKRTRTLHRALFMLLTAAMVLNMGLVPVFAEGSPLYTPPFSEAVQALMEMVDELPNAADPAQNKEEAAIPDFEAAAVAYEGLPAEEKAAFEATEQYEKLRALRGTLYSGSWINWKANQFEPINFPDREEFASKDQISALLEQMQQRHSISLMAEEEPLERIEVDNSRVIHRPVDYLPSPVLELGDVPATFGLIDSNQSGPFEERDERYFRVEVSQNGGADAYRAVKGRLVATGDNSNVWVLDDDDFHEKIGNSHASSTCNLNDVTYDMAKDLATGFDGIYSRMTADFGSFELYESGYTNMAKFGDLGDDNHVNILLYDIDALDSGSYVTGYFWNADMLDANQIFDDSEIIHPIDVFHVDIGTNQGWKSISGNATDKLEIYGTLAHEFQHMLFYTHFGAYLKEDKFPSAYYTWFNESLSGLAETYYVQPGAEIIHLSRTAFAASNPYDGIGYGDLFMFNSSMKNYGMGYLFSALFHNYTGGTYAGGVYDFFDSFGTATTEEGFVDKYEAVNYGSYTHPFYHVGAMLNSGLELEMTPAESSLALYTAYQYFMVSFAADGGRHMGTDMLTQKLLRGTAKEQNLWALRPLLGINGLDILPKIPTLSSGEKIVIDGTIGGVPYEAVTRDMMYKLEGSGNVINITVAALGKDKMAYPFLALPNPNSATGANIYPLTPGSTSEIVTNGRDAYLFVDTFLSAISESDNVTVTYTWEENAGAGKLNGKASINNITPRIGDTLTGSYTGTDISEGQAAYAWYVGESADSVGTDATYTVQASDLGKTISLVISDRSALDKGSVKAVTGSVKKRAYVGPAAMPPVVSAFTHNSVTLNTVEGREYSNGGEIWQDSPVFNGLSPNVTYNFYCRVKETADTEASEKSEGTLVKTDSVPPPSISVQPTGGTYRYGDQIRPLTISAEGSGAKLTYSWYKNTINSTTGGSLVSTADVPSYTPTVKDVGTYYYYCVVSKTVDGQSAVVSDTAAVEIEPRPITPILSVGGVSKAYDGNTTIVGTPPAISFTGAINGEKPTAAATFAYDTPAAGENKTVNAAGITLIDENPINSNYTLSANTARAVGAEITPAVPTYSVAAQKIEIGKDLAAIQGQAAATGVDGERVPGTRTWSTTLGGVPLDDYTFKGVASENITLYWTFTPSSTNYKKLSGSAVFTLTKKGVPVLTVSNMEMTYNGTAITTVSGIAKVGSAAVEGAFAFDDMTTMKDANTYQRAVKFVPTDMENYETAVTSITVTIRKAKADIGIALSQTHISAGDTLPTASIRYSGLVMGESLTPGTEATFTGMPSSSVKGNYVITWSNKAAMQAEIEQLSAYRNYTVSYKDSETLQISLGESGSSDSSSGGSSGSSSGGKDIVPPAQPDRPVTEETDATIHSDEDGKVTAKAEDGDIQKAIEKAKKAEKEEGIAITLNVAAKENTESLEVVLSATALTALRDAKVRQFTIDNRLTAVTFDLTALNALAGGEAVLTVSKADIAKLSKEAQDAISGRPVFRFGLTSGGKTVSDFKGGSAELQMNYTLAPSEQAGNLCGVYVDGSGKVNWLETSRYDPITGTMGIRAQHFSAYGIGYKESPSQFTDVGNHWAKNDIDFVVARGLLSGTSSTTFGPDISMTRGMFVTALGRLAGADTKQYNSTKFTDVKADAYYAPYVAWANENSIVRGTGHVTFSPEMEISRQEMAVMLMNYSKAMGYELPSIFPEASFVDAGSISPWAKDAVKEMQMAGILTGKWGGRFDPIGRATRGEVCAMLSRYVEQEVGI